MALAQLALLLPVAAAWGTRVARWAPVGVQLQTVVVQQTDLYYVAVFRSAADAMALARRACC